MMEEVFSVFDGRVAALKAEALVRVASPQLGVPVLVSVDLVRP